MTERKATIKDLKKGFVFFMDKEKIELARMRAKSRLRRKITNQTDEPSPQEWWAEEDLFRPISEYTLQQNEYMDCSKDTQEAPYKAKFNLFDSEQEQEDIETINTPGAEAHDLEKLKGDDDENSEETDDEFEWFEETDPKFVDDSFFVYVNKTRQTIEPGDQVYYCYGNRSNKFLLLNYGFCFQNNKYDSYEIPMRLDLPFEEIVPSELVDLKFLSAQAQPIRFKNDQINEVMVGYLRSCCKKSYLKMKGLTDTKKRILLTLPTLLDYEQYVFANYMSILLYIQDQLNILATLEQDVAQLKSTDISFEKRMVITYRLEKKKIVKSQINIILKTLDVLSNIKKTIFEAEDKAQQSTKYTELLLGQTLAEKQEIAEIAQDDSLSKEEKHKLLV